MIPLPDYTIQFIVRPKKVYKFYRIDDNFRDGIKNSYLWFSSPSDFNDPFDNNPNLVGIDPTEEFIRNFFQRHKNDDKVNRSERRRAMHNAIRNKEMVKNALHETLSEGFAKRGICCFSTYNTNILMWSHYASKHQGVCLQFDTSLLPLEFVLLKVKYVTEFEKLYYQDEPERALLAAQTTKYKDWEYEDEIRILMDKNGKVDFPKAALKEVVFGCMCSKSEEDEVKKIINESGYKVSFRKAKRVPEQFQIKIT